MMKLHLPHILEIVLFLLILFKAQPEVKGFSGARPGTYILVLLWIIASNVLILMGSYTWLRDLLEPIVSGSRGLIHYNLVINLTLLLVMLVIMKGAGKLRLRDVGLNINAFIPGMTATLLIWICVQITYFVMGWLTNGKVDLSFDTGDIPITEWIGIHIGYIFGVGLYEEVVFRGFLFVQLFLLIPEKFVKSTGTRFMAAVIVSQLIFGLVHIPRDIVKGVEWVFMLNHILAVVGAGIFFVFAYLRTNNLFLVAGIHGLIDYAPPVFNSELAGQFDPSFSVYIVYIYSIFLVILLKKKYNFGSSQSIKGITN